MPTARRILLQRPRRALGLALRGQLGQAVRLGLATCADAWNYFGPAERAAACPCCGWHGPAFLAHAGRRVAFQSVCPVCGARSRHRGLARGLATFLEGMPEGRFLVFAPEAVLLTVLGRIGCSVATTDAFSVDVDHPGEDIQALSFSDRSHAGLMCNHVLEHVEDDHAAVRECARIVKPGGIALFTIPGDFSKAPTREYRRPDGNGHYRHYGREVEALFRESFSRVDVIDLATGAPEEHWIHPNELLFRCTR